MARALKINFGGFVEEVAEAVVTEATIDLHSKLKLYEAASRAGLGTPVDTGVLIGNWQVTMDNPRQGRVFNNLIYAEPVITGENLPPSWGGQYRTQQGTQKNYHESILDEVAEKDLPKIVRSVSRRLS
tara:strand:+ start:303 stop:686 length:384 start_codon:yes stop_codon:yes gene_type:complete